MSETLYRTWGDALISALYLAAIIGLVIHWL